MSEIKKKRLDLKIMPALAPSLVGTGVAFLVIGENIGALISALVAGYFAFLMANLLIELISLLRRRQR